MINKEWTIWMGKKRFYIFNAPSAQEACEHFGAWGLENITKIECADD